MTRGQAEQRVQDLLVLLLGEQNASMTRRLKNALLEAVDYAKQFTEATVDPALASLAAEYDANPEKVLKKLGKEGGIHFRSHRDPSKQGDFVVIKLWKQFPRELLVKFLEARGVKATVKTGQYKWVAVIPREKWKGEVDGQASKTELDAIMVGVSVDAQQKQQQDAKQKEKEAQKKYTLSYQGQDAEQQQQVHVGYSKKSDTGGHTGGWKPSGKYTL